MLDHWLYLLIASYYNDQNLSPIGEKSQDHKIVRDGL